MRKTAVPLKWSSDREAPGTARCVRAVFLCREGDAQERILSYDILVEVRKDASLDVTERIAVRAEGSQIRRGIYRDFPTRYKDRFGNQVKVDLDVKSVEKNDVVEPWFTEKMSNGVRINTGNDDFLAVPADYVYTLRYRTTSLDSSRITTSSTGMRLERDGFFQSSEALSKYGCHRRYLRIRCTQKRIQDHRVRRDRLTQRVRRSPESRGTR